MGERLARFERGLVAEKQTMLRPRYCHGQGLAWLVCVSGFASGCWDMTQGKDAKIPGDELGTYHVISHIDDSSCGPGAMGSEDVWEFDVKLSRAGRDLFWLNGREAIPGRIAADGVSFVLDSEVVAEIRPRERGNPGCTLQRLDQASGKLGAPGSDVLDFEGRLRFGYLPTPGSDCSELLGVPGGFFSLPCEMSYRMSATRSAAPR